MSLVFFRQLNRYIFFPKLIQKYFILSILERKNDNDCSTFWGTDENGLALHITQYKIPLNLAVSVSINKIIENIENEFLRLIELKHDNIINFRNIKISKDSDFLVVLLARDVINGVSIRTFSKMTNWPIRILRQLTEALLEALSYLQRNGISCGNINDSSIYLDNSGMWKLADFSITPYLNHLVKRGKTLYIRPHPKSDLNEIADLIEALGVTSSQVTDFIDKCRIASNFSELMEHQLLQTLNRSFDDFTVMKVLGSGGFGEVLKVKDGRVDKEYAVKRIKIDPKTKTNKNTLAKANAEVRVLAKLTSKHNKHIVRYYRNWTEIMAESEYKSYEKSDDEMDVDEQSSHEPAQALPKRTNRYTFYFIFKFARDAVDVY